MAEPIELPEAPESILQRLKIYPVLAELKECLCAQLGGEQCFCGIVVGETVPLGHVGLDGEMCDTGTAYVRVSTIVTAANFPQPDQNPNVRGKRSYTVAVGILRTAPIGERNSGPTQEEEDAYGLRLLADMQLTWEAVNCCINDTKFPDLQYTGLAFQWVDRSGGAGGGEWSFLAQD